MKPAVYLLVLAVPAVGCDSGLGPEGLSERAPLRAMTFNIGQDDGTPGEGPDGWSNPEGPRRDEVLALLDAEQPDIVGLQEALWGQVQDLDAGLSGYEWVGVGRDDGAEAGEFSPIFYRGDRYEHVAHGTFWLSDTPSVPGSSYPDAAINIATWLEVTDLESERPVLILNSHWDEDSAEARAFGASFIVQQLEFLAPEPRARIVLGDFNCTEDSEPMDTLRNGGHLDDAYRVAHPVAEPDEGTYHGFEGDPTGARIDYLMVSTGLFDVERAEIVRTGGTEAGWPSDHFPEVGDLTW